ncbi:PLP-dependent transferase, partial [Bacillus pumilus]|uniref:PLP-dependent transferase n=1 Tax=Bacillus pumilus TaxID=1408 RepID=UPI0016423D8E
NSTGPILPPHHSSLLITAIKTLPLTMEPHQQNPHRIPHFLHQHPPLTPLYYPPLHPHPPHQLPKTQPSAYPP